MKNSNKLFNYLIWFGVITSTFTLAIYAYLGIFTRYLADDYCLLVSLNNADNIFSASWEKYINSSNRYSNLFILSIWEFFPNNIALVPAVHVVLWIVGLSWLFFEINKLFKLQVSLLFVLLVSELLALFTFYTTPNLFQVLYWRPGQVTYFTPVILFTLVTAWLVKIVRLQPEKNLTLYAVFFTFLAFFIGGLSETIGVYHLGILLVAIIFVYFYDKSPRRKIALTLLIALLLGAFVSILVMFLAPANSLRVNIDNSMPPYVKTLLTILRTPGRSLNYTYAFLQNSFTTLPLPHIILILVSSLFSYLLFNEKKTKETTTHFRILFALIPFLTFVVIFITFTPTAYGQSYPVERVRFPAHLILNIALIALSASIGYWLSQLKLPNFVNHVAFVSLALVLMYPLWMARAPLQTYEYRRLWSKRWDERQNMIYSAIHNGETDIFVPGLDGYEGAKELENDPNFWTNKCAAQYYGVNTIDVFSIEEEHILEFFSE